MDVEKNRRQKKWTRSENVRRVLWALLQPLFKLSPRPLWSWRRFLMVSFGAKVGKDVHIYPTAKISIPWNISIGSESAIGHNVILYALGKVDLGSRVTISQGAHICAGTHDITKNHRPLIKSRITIQQDVWIAADAFIGPDVEIGKNSIIGARSVVFSNVPSNTIVIGNPARILKRVPNNS